MEKKSAGWDEYAAQVGARRSPLTALGLRRKHDLDDAQDLAGDAVSIALQQEDWRQIQNVGAWMYKTWLNVEANHITKAARRRRLDAVAMAKQKADAVLPDVADEICEKDEHEQQFTAIIEASGRAGLTQRQDYVFLARTNGTENDEIARTLGISVDSVRATYSVAIQKIRATLGVSK